jgi:hypothetical protein
MKSAAFFGLAVVCLTLNTAIVCAEMRISTLGASMFLHRIQPSVEALQAWLNLGAIAFAVIGAAHLLPLHTIKIALVRVSWAPHRMAYNRLRSVRNSCNGDRDCRRAEEKRELVGIRRDCQSHAVKTECSTFFGCIANAKRYALMLRKRRINLKK